MAAIHLAKQRCHPGHEAPQQGRRAIVEQADLVRTIELSKSFQHFSLPGCAGKRLSSRSGSRVAGRKSASPSVTKVATTRQPAAF